MNNKTKKDFLPSELVTEYSVNPSNLSLPSFRSLTVQVCSEPYLIDSTTKAQSYEVKVFEEENKFKTMNATVFPSFMKADYFTELSKFARVLDLLKQYQKSTVSMNIEIRPIRLFFFKERIGDLCAVVFEPDQKGLENKPHNELEKFSHFCLEHTRDKLVPCNFVYQNFGSYVVVVDFTLHGDTSSVGQLGRGSKGLEGLKEYKRSHNCGLSKGSSLSKSSKDSYGSKYGSHGSHGSGSSNGKGGSYIQHYKH